MLSLIIFALASCRTASQNEGNAETSINSENAVIQTESETSKSALLENPKAVVISNLKIPGQAIDLKVSGNYLYVTNDLGYLYIVDINDKLNPEVIGKCAGIDAANIVFIEGNYAYISYSKYDFKTEELKVDYGFKIVDIKNKEQPKVAGNWGGESIGADKSVHGMFVRGDYALLNLDTIDENGSTGTFQICLLYTSPSPRDRTRSRMPSSA